MATQTWQQAQAARDVILATAYDEGVRNGKLDRSIGLRSEYAWHARSDGGYTGAYATGYYEGYMALRAKNPWRR